MTMAAARLDRRRLEHFSLWNLGRVVSSAGKLNASFVRSISVSPVHAALISDVRFVVVVVAFSSPPANLGFMSVYIELNVLHYDIYDIHVR